MSIFRDLVAGLEQFDPDVTGLRVTRVVIGDEGTFQTAKGDIMSDGDTALNQGPVVPIQSVLPKGEPIEDRHVFRSVNDPESWLVMEWTPAALEEIKKEGKRIAVSFNLNNYGQLCPEMRAIEKFDVRADQSQREGVTS